MSYNNCCILNCSSTRNNNKLHLFPRSNAGIQKWLQCIDGRLRTRSLSRDNLRKTFVCRKHFEKRFVCNNGCKARIRFNGYPTLFTDREIANGLPHIVIDDIRNNSLEHDHDYGEGRKHIEHNYCKTSENERIENEIAELTLQEVTEVEQAGVAKSTLSFTSDGGELNGTEIAELTLQEVTEVEQTGVAKSTLSSTSDGGELNDTVSEYTSPEVNVIYVLAELEKSTLPFTSDGAEFNDTEITELTLQEVTEVEQAGEAKSTLSSTSDGGEWNGTVSEYTSPEVNVIYVLAELGKSTLPPTSDGAELNGTVETPYYVCELCPYTSEIPEDMLHHRSLHRVCTCGHVAETPPDYDQHRATCGGEMSEVARVSCDKCGREYLDLESFAQHYETIQPCALCSLPVCEASAHAHHNTEHRPKYKRKRVRGRPRFTCVECGWSSVIKRDIMLHLIHHPQSSAMDVSVLTQCGILQEQLPTEC